MKASDAAYEVLAKAGAPIHVKDLLVEIATAMKVLSNQTRGGSDESGHP